jgi:arginine:ornithine antiporter/lysine permease
MTTADNNKLGLISLIALCVGSMIGSGLFALPQNVAYTSGPGALAIAWVITFIGMLCLAKVFQNLSLRYPQLDAGVYSYAKAGLGDYLGFCSAWGYWISAWIGNIGYVMILCSALSLFFPILGGGVNLYSLILSSVMIWLMTFLCISGIRSATIVNNITTFGKIIPIVIFIVIIAYAFNKNIFVQDLWAKKTFGTGSILEQIKGTMLITVWTFIGIEGASVFSARAKNRKDVGRATMIGFLIVFSVLVLVSELPFGILSQSALDKLPDPSTGSILANVIGKPGAVLINIGLIISVIGALLSWILLAVEVPFIAAQRDHLFPKIFSTENKKHAPYGVLLITAACQQVYLIIAHIYHNGYLATILISTSMILIPYLFSALFALIAVVKGTKYSFTESKIRRQDLVISGLASVYGFWLIYAAGIKYLALSTILYFIGSLLFIINKKNLNKTVFKPHEWAVFGVCSFIAIVSMVMIIKGTLSV